MAEPYVPIARYNTTNTLLTELEVTTDAAETYTDDLETAVANSLTHKQTAENLVASGFDLFFLVGC
jgi:hypothetical protein